MQKVVVTGAAGFIGSHLAHTLLKKGFYVIAIDAMNPYYDVRLKQTHLNQIKAIPEAEKNFHYFQFDINEENRCAELFDAEKPDVIVHLAAQAGVRYCQAHPEEAENNNIKTTRLLLDLAHREGSSVKQFLFASSSSIYGTHPRPWQETYEPRPEGIYGESKAKGEVMCKSIFKPNQVSIAAMRFFTVYGPFGRPDMAPAKFMDIIHRGKIVPVYGDGSAIRDFTFIEDIIQGIALIIQHPNFEKFEIYNLGKGTETPNSVLDLIHSIEQNLNKKAVIDFTDPKAGDVPATQADISKAQKELGYKPEYTLEDGIKKTAAIYFRTINKFPLLLLHTKDNVSLLTNQVAAISGQTQKPNMVVLVDQSEENVEKNKEILLSLAGVTVKHLTVSSSITDMNTVWNAGVAYLKEQLESKEIESFEEASNVFVSFLTGELAWNGSEIASLIEEISTSGSEYVGDKNVSLLRLDVLLSVLDKLSSATTPAAYLSQVNTAVCKESNIRIQYKQ